LGSTDERGGRPYVTEVIYEDEYICENGYRSMFELKLEVPV